MNRLILIAVIILVASGCLYSQPQYPDATPESKHNQSAYRKVSGNEQQNVFNRSTSKIPANLMEAYNNAVDMGDEQGKVSINSEIEKYLNQAPQRPVAEGMGFAPVNEAPFTDWYNTDVQVTTSDVAYTGGYRQIILKQGEDGWMYLAVNRRNITNTPGNIAVYRSSNGGVSWGSVTTVYAENGYYGSIDMLVESRDNGTPDSTRIILYYTYSPTSNYNNAELYMASFRRNGSSAYLVNVAEPTAGNRFVDVSACSDGMFYAGATYMHAVVREESNTGTFVALRHYRTTSWGATHSFGTIQTSNDDKFPVCGFSNETGSDSIYVAVQRNISANESEIRLIALPTAPGEDYRVRYITDASSGTIYERPAITIQQRIASLPQRILVTCTKNDRAVYHYSIDGGAEWNIDYNLGMTNQAVDYTSCSSDSLASGGDDFMAAYVDLNGDSITVRHGELGSMGTMQHKRNSFNSTGALAPACAIYKTGSNKQAAYSYAGTGPTSVYYNMASLLTAVEPVSNEIPGEFSLSQNYPNPFNPVTNIKFSVPKAGFVTLKVYDIAGKEVAQLVSSNMNAGVFNYDFDASYLSSGVYFYRLTADGFTDVKKMMLIK